MKDNSSKIEVFLFHFMRIKLQIHMQIRQEFAYFSEGFILHLASAMKLQGWNKYCIEHVMLNKIKLVVCTQHYIVLPSQMQTLKNILSCTIFKLKI